MSIRPNLQGGARMNSHAEGRGAVRACFGRAHERRLRVGGCLHARADAEELLRLADVETSIRPATRTRPD